MAGPARVRIDVIGDSRSAVQAAKETQSAFGGLTNTLRTFGRIAFAAGIVASSRAAVNAASDMNESLSKSNAIFGSSARAIEAWAKTSARSFGQSQQQALENAASFGNMFRQMEIGVGSATRMSKSMVELASDFASFHNADITQVLQAQQAAFRGEYDAVQRFVPTINAAAVETKALAMTGKENAEQLTAQEKATATYRLILDGAGKAMGDFDRTSASAANQQRILNASLQNLAASLGAVLLPIFTKVIGVLADLADVLLSLPGPIRTVVVALGIGGAAWALWADAISSAARVLVTLPSRITDAALALAAWIERLNQARVAQLAMLGGLGLVAAGLIALGFYLTSQPGQWDRAKEAAGRWIDVVKSGAEASGDAIAFLRNELVLTVNAALIASHTSDGLSDAVLKQKARYDELKGALADARLQQREAAAAERERVASLDAVASGTTAVADATDDAQRAIQEYQNTILAVQGGEIGYRAAVLAVMEAEARLNEVRADSTASALEVSQAENNLAQAKLGVSTAALKLNEDTQTLSTTQRVEAVAGANAMRSALLNHIATLGDDTGAIGEQIRYLDALILKLEAVPAAVPPPMPIYVNTDPVYASLAQLDRDLDAWKQQAGGWIITPAMATTMAAVPRVARTAGGNLRAVSTTAPAAVTTRAAAPTIHVNVTTTGLGADAPEIQRQVVRAIRGYVDRNGPIERITP